MWCIGTHLSGQLQHIDAHLDIEKETIDLQNYVNYNYIIIIKKKKSIIKFSSGF